MTPAVPSSDISPELVGTFSSTYYYFIGVLASFGLQFFLLEELCLFNPSLKDVDIFIVLNFEHQVKRNSTYTSSFIIHLLLFMERARAPAVFETVSLPSNMCGAYTLARIDRDAGKVDDGATRA